MSIADVTPVHAPLSALLDGTPVRAPLSALLGGRPAERIGDRIGDRNDRKVRAVGTVQRAAELPGVPAMPAMSRAAITPAIAPTPRAAIAPAIAPALPPLIAPAPTDRPSPPAAAVAAAVPSPAAAPYAIGGLAIAMIGSIGFSGKAIIVKVAYRYGVDAVTLIMYRMLVALLPFLIIAWWSGRGKPPLSWRDRGSIFILGVTGYYLASYLDFVGLQYISASLERLILYLNPTLVFAFGLLWFGQRATRQQIVAIATGYAGMLVVFGSEISFVGDNVLLGTALVFAGAVSYALYISYSGALVKRIGSMRLVGWASTVACLLCFAQFLLLRPLSAALVPAPVLWLSLINGTACTVAPVLLLMIAIQRVGATTAAQASLLGPISTIAMSIFILGEPFTPWVAVGTVLVIGSISMLARKPAIAR
jgi:drug/metabolite transporter (DMT)-like permease